MEFVILHEKHLKNNPFFRLKVFRRFVDRKKAYILIRKDFQAVKLPLPSKRKVIIINTQNDRIYIYVPDKDLEKLLSNYLKNIDNKEEGIYTLLSKILDLYSSRLNKLSKMLAEEREKIFNYQDLDLEKVDKIMKNLEDLEDFTDILKDSYRLLIKDPSYLQLLTGELNSLIDEIREIRNKVEFLLDLQNNIQQKILNKRMERLTMISTLFLPATLIASIYGMNFKFSVIPNWEHRHGFLIAITTIILSSILTYLLIKLFYKRWF